jgi:hypothetical protein
VDFPASKRTSFNSDTMPLNVGAAQDVPATPVETPPYTMLTSNAIAATSGNPAEQRHHMHTSELPTAKTRAWRHKKRKDSPPAPVLLYKSLFGRFWATEKYLATAAV